MVLDLSEVTYMDCAGLAPMLAARARLGDRFWLRGLQPPVTRLLQLAGLDEARAEVERAASLTRNRRERTLLLDRAAACDQPVPTNNSCYSEDWNAFWPSWYPDLPAWWALRSPAHAAVRDARARSHTDSKADLPTKSG